MDKKITYNLKIDDADFNQAIRAFVVASNYIYSNAPRGDKNLKSKNLKIAMELTKAMNNLLFKYPSEVLKK
tara:strand:+ start:480 stop:692 length:213 start_codon:yes stop_codon:yes gene_type:complete